MEAVIQISEVNSEEQISKKTGRRYTRYHILGSDGRDYTTLTAADGTAAGQLRGQSATITYSEQQNGKYTNYYLESIKPAEGLTTLPSHTEVVTPPSNPAGTVGTFSAPGVTHNISYRDDKSAQINRSVAFKAAVELVGAGVLSIDGLEDLDKLTGKLIPIVDGTYVSGDAVPFETTSQSSGVDADLVKF